MGVVMVVETVIVVWCMQVDTSLFNDGGHRGPSSLYTWAMLVDDAIHAHELVLIDHQLLLMEGQVEDHSMSPVARWRLNHHLSRSSSKNELQNGLRAHRPGIQAFDSD